jgi:hypothetical protein
MLFIFYAILGCTGTVQYCMYLNVRFLTLYIKFLQQILFFCFNEGRIIRTPEIRYRYGTALFLIPVPAPQKITSTYVFFPSLGCIW